MALEDPGSFHLPTVLSSPAGLILRFASWWEQEDCTAPCITSSCNNAQRQTKKKNMCFFLLPLYEMQETFPRSPSRFSLVLLWPKLHPLLVPKTNCGRKKWTGHGWPVIFHQRSTPPGATVEIGVFWLVSMIGDIAGMSEGMAKNVGCPITFRTVYKRQTGLFHCEEPFEPS